MWLLRWLLTVHLYSHKEHLNGFSFVCVLMCCWRLPLKEQLFSRVRPHVVFEAAACSALSGPSIAFVIAQGAHERLFSRVRPHVALERAAASELATARLTNMAQNAVLVAVHSLQWNCSASKHSRGRWITTPGALLRDRHINMALGVHLLFPTS
eukprot:g69799.t1